MKRTKEEAEQTRQEIFEAGLRVFSEKGFAAATMSDVAREAGISRGAIYWHFRTKDEFIQEVEGRLSAAYKELLEEALSRDEPLLELLEETVRALIHRYLRDPEWRAMQELVLRVSLSHGGHGNELKSVSQDQKAIEALSGAIERGEIYSGWEPKTALFCLGSTLSGLFLQITHTNMALSDKQIEEIAAFVARGLATGREPLH